MIRRELIPAGQTGGLVMFQDRPNYWDAWGTSLLHFPAYDRSDSVYFVCFVDVEIHHLEKRTELKFASAQVVAEGPLRASIETQVKYGNSTINVTVRIYRYSSSLSHVLMICTMFGMVDLVGRHYRYVKSAQGDCSNGWLIEGFRH